MAAATLPRKETPAASYVLQAAAGRTGGSDEDNPVIIAEAETVVHEMAVSDAVMQMDLSDQPVRSCFATRATVRSTWSTAATTAISVGSILRARTENAGTALAARSAMALIHQTGWHMHLADLIGPEAVIASLKVKNKKQLLQELSARAARLTGLEERDIFDVLLAA